MGIEEKRLEAKRKLAKQKLELDSTITQPVEEEVKSEESGIPLLSEVAEFAAAINRPIIETLDFLGPDTANAVLSLAGAETRIPSLAESIPGTQGGFMEEGVQRQAVRAAGETIPMALGAGTALRSMASKLGPQLAGESVGAGTLRQLAGTTAAQDVGLGAASGAGAAVGEEEGGAPGALVGAILAPLAATAGTQALKGLINTGAQGVEALTKSLSKMSEEGASKLLANAMVREGLTPDDIALQMKQLGPEAIPADLGINFSRLLRTASNEIPRIEGRASDVLKARQAGQTDRIIDALDDASGTSTLNVDDEIVRLNEALGPKINDLYGQARAKSIEISPKLSSLFEGKSSIGRAQRKAQKRIADKRAAGDEIGNIDVIDATKQELDDQIGKSLRQGEKHKARDLVRLKNVMVEEADTAIPEYKQARDLFAGKAQLENAADTGSMFFKLKPREVDEFTKSMGDSEKKMFKLGAKQAVIDKVEDLQTNADAVKRLFGKRGDVSKLKTLFDDEKAFNNFSNALEREANFILTRRAAQANSTTTKQLSDVDNASDVLGDARALMGDPVAAANKFGQILGGLTEKKQSEAFTRSLEQAGDILLESGMKPERLVSILKKGNRKEIELALKKAFDQAKPSEVVAPTLKAAGASLTSLE